MWIFYACASIPIFIGLMLLVLDKKLVWQEWVIGAVTALVLAGIFNIVAVCDIHSKTHDTETWSGKLSSATHYAAWKEYYEYAVYRTEYYTVSVSNSNGKGSHSEERSRRVFDHWEPTTRWHQDAYRCWSTIDTDYNIELGMYTYIVKKFGSEVSVAGDRTTSEHNSRMLEGDPNDYQARNISNWIEPVTKEVAFENRIKATPNLFSYSAVPTNIPVYNWPNNPNWNVSDRVMGTAIGMIHTLKFDQLNARLGAAKKVNLIIIGFGDKSEDMGHYQESKFIGGRKNDLVITYGGGSTTNHAAWCYVFGFTEQNIVKQNIETILLTNPINDDILSKIETEVGLNYRIEDWTKFNYISIEPATWIYFWYFGLMILIQVGLYTFFHLKDLSDVFNNDYSNFGTINRYGRRRY